MNYDSMVGHSHPYPPGPEPDGINCYTPQVFNFSFFLAKYSTKAEHTGVNKLTNIGK